MNTMNRSILFLSSAGIFIASCTVIKEANNSLPDDTYYSLEEASVLTAYNREHPLNNQPTTESRQLAEEGITTNSRASESMEYYRQRANSSTDTYPSFMDSINSIQPNSTTGIDNFNLSGTNYITNNYGIDPYYSTRLRSYYAPSALSLSYYDPFYGGGFFNSPFYGSSFGLNYGYGGVGFGMGLNYGYGGFFSPYNYGYGGFYGCNPYYYNAFYNPFYNPYGCFGNVGIYDYCTTGVYYTGRVRTNTIYGPRTRANSREERYSSGEGLPSGSTYTSSSAGTITTNRNALNGGLRTAEGQKNAFLDNLIRGGTTSTGAPTRNNTYMSGPNKQRSTTNTSTTTPGSSDNTRSNSSPNTYQAPARGAYQPAPSRQNTQQFTAPANTNPTPNYSAPTYSAPSRSYNNSGGGNNSSGGGRSTGGGGSSGGNSNGGGGRRGR